MTGLIRGRCRRDCFALAVCIILSLFLFVGCSSREDTSDNGNGNTDIAPETDINHITVQDKASVYEQDDDDSVVTMYLTVRRGNDSDNTNHSWQEVNDHSVYYYEEQGIERYKVEGILQVGDENGPLPDEVGYFATVPNVTVQIRGATSSRAEQKSYKIRFKKDKGEWNGQRTIALNKHAYDSVRFRNKLSYDLIKTIPNMIGARTQFVHLYVKDQTGENSADAQFVDYGLYTQVEQLNTRYLRNHGLDENGQLYKANMFEFQRYAETIKLKDDETYDQAAFEEILEIKGNDDHSKLIAMLDDLNNYSLPIEEVFSKYFDEENYFTWLAFQMLSGNQDITSQNFYLYSPQLSDKWYFISWDNDDAWSYGEDLMEDAEMGYSYDRGISNYWGSVLHQRVLKSADYRKKLDDKVNEIRSLITRELLTEKVNLYSAVVKPYLFQMPDNMHAVSTESLYEQILQTIPLEIDYNYQMYLTSLDYPMPFYVASPVLTENGISYAWDPSYDLDGEAVTYTFELAKDHAFTQIISKQEGLVLPQTIGEKLATGQYFFRVTATNSSGKTQTAMEIYEGEDEIKRYGVRCFYVLPDGTLQDG